MDNRRAGVRRGRRSAVDDRALDGPVTQFVLRDWSRGEKPPRRSPPGSRRRGREIGDGAGHCRAASHTDVFLGGLRRHDRLSPWPRRPNHGNWVLVCKSSSSKADAQHAPIFQQLQAAQVAAKRPAALELGLPRSSPATMVRDHSGTIPAQQFPAGPGRRTAGKMGGKWAGFS